MKLDPQPPCERTRRELAAYLYDELDARTRNAADEHLAVCAACRSELAESRAALDQLADWQLFVEREDPRTLAGRARALAGSAKPSHGPRARGRLVRLSATLSGAAAALLVVLAFLGTELTLRDGELHLRLAMPWTSAATVAPPLDPVPTREVLEPALRRIAAEEFTTRAVSLVQAVDRSQAEDRRAIQALTGLIDELSRRQVLQDRRTKEALVELTEAVFDLHE